MADNPMIYIDKKLFLEGLSKGEREVESHPMG